MALRTHRCAIQHQGFPEGKGARGAKKPLDDEVVRRSGAAGAGAMCVCACVGGRNDWLVLACGSQLCVTTVLQHHTLRAFMAAHIHTHTRTQKARPYTVHNTIHNIHTLTHVRAQAHTRRRILASTHRRAGRSAHRQGAHRAGGTSIFEARGEQGKSAIGTVIANTAREANARDGHVVERRARESSGADAGVTVGEEIEPADWLVLPESLRW